MTHKHLDFNSDKTVQYGELRKRMAKKHETHFGNEREIIVNEDMTPEGMADGKKINQEIKKGYNRVMEKIKEIRQGYSTDITTGSRSVAVVK